MNTLLRASISSAVATAADGIAYQLLLAALVGSYTAAAFFGAVLGALANFAVNRRWVFKATGKRLRKQATEYALASFATFLALQSCLVVFIEFFQFDERGAWVPAKLLAWLLVSYPSHRFLVFAVGAKKGIGTHPVSERPPIAV